MPNSWERVVATAKVNALLYDAVWSPCNRFIAVPNVTSVELLDAVTLGRLCVFELPSTTSDHLLGFSPDSRFLMLCMGEEFISWDLRTGGRLSTISLELDYRDTIYISFKLSKDGKMVAVAYKSRDFGDINNTYDTFINTYDLLSGERVGSCRVPEGRMTYPIWTHDEYLRFATIHPKLITIWQSPFTLEHPPVEVTSLPVPDGIIDAERFLFLPSLSRIAFVLGGAIQVWDLKVPPKLLLKSEPVLTLENKKNSRSRGSPCGSFSSDGRFFAYSNSAGEVYVWEESPVGYLLHQRLPFFPSRFFRGPRLSPDGESIIIPLNFEIHRWHTRDQDLSLLSVLTQDFTLGFSADEKFAAFARRKENLVTIIDLQSGEPRWITDVGVKIDCLRMAGSTVVLVGEEKIITWNLPGGDCTFNASVHGVVRTTFLDPSSPSHNLGTPRYMSIFPDLSRIVVARMGPTRVGSVLEVDSVSTGLSPASIKTRSVMIPRFTQDGREVWVGRDIISAEWKQCEIIEDGESGTVELKFPSAQGLQSKGFWESSSGYAVTDSRWILSPSQKRLLWLPHRWRSVERAWGGRFLGFLDGELSEAVVLEFLE